MLNFVNVKFQTISQVDLFESLYLGLLYSSHWSRVTHICFTQLRHHLIMKWLVTCSAPSHLNQCLLSVSQTQANIFQSDLNQNAIIFNAENEFENVVCKLVAILSLSQCVRLQCEGPYFLRPQCVWHKDFCMKTQLCFAFEPLLMILHLNMI